MVAVAKGWTTKIFCVVFPAALANMADYFGTSIVISILPYYLTANGYSNVNTITGKINSLQNFAQMLGALFWGRMSDKYVSPSKLLIFIMVCDAVFFGVTATVKDTTVMYPVRFFAGFFTPTSTAYKYIATRVSGRANFVVATSMLGFVNIFGLCMSQVANSILYETWDWAGMLLMTSIFAAISVVPLAVQAFGTGKPPAPPEQKPSSSEAEKGKQSQPSSTTSIDVPLSTLLTSTPVLEMFALHALFGWTCGLHTLVPYLVFKDVHLMSLADASMLIFANPIIQMVQFLFLPSLMNRYFNVVYLISLTNLMLCFTAISFIPQCMTVLPLHVFFLYFVWENTANNYVAMGTKVLTSGAAQHTGTIAGLARMVVGLTFSLSPTISTIMYDAVQGKSYLPPLFIALGTFLLALLNISRQKRRSMTV